jgi:hypothetical protein
MKKTPKEAVSEKIEETPRTQYSFSSHMGDNSCSLFCQPGDIISVTSGGIVRSFGKMANSNFPSRRIIINR